MSLDDEYEMTYLGPIGFDRPVPLSVIPAEHDALRFLPEVITCRYTGAGAERALVEIEAVADTDGWAGESIWGQILRAMELIARRQGRSLRTTAKFESDERGRGTLVVDEGGRFHDCQDVHEVEPHRTRTCDCWWVEEPADGVFIVGDVTKDESVRVDELPAGPFIDFVVSCSEHGEVFWGARHREAVFRREAHLVAEHTVHPLPLGRQPALELLPVEVQHHLQQAAVRLRESRSYHPALGIKHREAAREHARHAEDRLLQSAEPAELISVLLRGLIERTADRLPPEQS